MEHRVRSPLSERDVSKLSAGDIVWLSGTIYTARDKAHQRLQEVDFDLKGGVIYHCGPLIRDKAVVSAGPTSSVRLARYLPQVLDLGVRCIIGKGGMPGAAELLRGRAVYLAYPGGCGAAAARSLSVRDVCLPELGMAEAVWRLEATDLGPMVVAMDSHGRDLYGEVREYARRHLKR
ncbi:MAG: FumA C-terminus/TtdB family hydratase beta subunit [Methanothrix sp.]|uniref:FumA C-terminus/TtdB family hydratase beta subunit n=1 Tax=Methanothrix sp. TaxID=90426 RepID=UPI0032AF2C5D|nr:FumA C-terminus/TtdB family hydratase beta subunit [Methanothrix sp.]